MTPAEVIELRTQAAIPYAADYVIAFAQMGLRALGERAYQWATLLLVAGAFAFVLWQPSTPRIVSAALFTVLVHVPTYWKGGSHGTSRPQAVDA